ncbi:MAG: CoA transferase [Pseudomonadota bacterium]
MKEIASAIGLELVHSIRGEGDLPSRFAVTDLAVASVGAVASSLARLIDVTGLASRQPAASVNRHLASLWFAQSVHPQGWELPPLWDAIAGVYEGKDGWIRLHTNLPHHRRAAVRALGVAEDRHAVEGAIRSWAVDDLEAAIAQAGGVSAAMRSMEAWAQHPQGRAVADEPLVAWREADGGSVRDWQGTLERPLAGLRVLDLTRVLAGPVATRTLAGFGADVLRVDPPDWDEPNVVPDITLGKRCCRLDLRSAEGVQTFKELLAGADVLVHGYRPGALDGLGLGEAERREIAPSLIDVSLDAYGWTGPWAGRRGFDSLVQMSCGIAHAGMAWAGRDVPTPLPVQALDHATGYLIAASVIRALTSAIEGKGIWNARLSLARTAALLMQYPQERPGELAKQPEDGDLSADMEETPWGPARRLKPPISIAGTPMRWDRPACELGSSAPGWP